MKKKILISGLIIVGVLFSGCSRTTQSIAIPDISQPISKDKSVIKLERPKSLFGAARSPYVYSNGKLIGELGYGGTLIWSTESNQLECMHIAYNRLPLIVDPIIWDEKPIPYFCFTAKPGEVTKLVFTPFNGIIKKSNGKKSIDTFEITKISNISKADTKYDIVALLKNAVTNKLGNKLVANNADESIELFIEEYQEGNAAKRWLAITKKGSTLLKVKVVVKKNNEIIDTYVVRYVVAQGGLFTVGADKLIFDYVGKSIASNLIGEPVN